MLLLLLSKKLNQLLLSEVNLVFSSYVSGLKVSLLVPLIRT